MGKHDNRHFVDRAERVAMRVAKHGWHRLNRSSRQQHVFVAGMQRSGTNMVMEVLDRSFHTDVFHETDSRAFEHYEMRPDAVIRSLAAKSGAPFFVIKALCELDRVKALMEAFPPAKTIWIVRDFNDSVNSAVASFSHFAARMARMSEDRLSDGWYGRGMSDATHALLKQTYHPNISETSAAAMMWYYRNALFFDQGLHNDPRALLVKYESLVTEPQNEFPRIFSFLGIPYSPWLSRHVFASSVRRKPAPNIDKPIAELCEALTHRFDQVHVSQQQEAAA